MNKCYVRAFSTIEKANLKYWLLGLLLYGFYLAGHNPVSDLCYYIRDTYTETVYKAWINISGAVLVIIHLLWVVRRLRHRSSPYKLAIWWLMFVLTIGISYRNLIVFDIEYVHFIQYCCLTMVMYHATGKRYWSAVVICLLAGLLDEGYQAYRVAESINWRDVLLNVIGVIWGWLVLQTRVQQIECGHKPDKVGNDSVQT